MGTALLGIAGGFDAAAKGPYSFWTSIPTIIAYIMFCLSLVGFFCAIRDVPIPPPIGSRGAKSAAPAVIPPAEETLPKDPEPVRSGQARAALTLPGVKNVEHGKTGVRLSRTQHIQVGDDNIHSSPPVADGVPQAPPSDPSERDLGLNESQAEMPGKTTDLDGLDTAQFELMRMTAAVLGDLLSLLNELGRFPRSRDSDLYARKRLCLRRARDQLALVEREVSIATWPDVGWVAGFSTERAHVQQYVSVAEKEPYPPSLTGEISDADKKFRDAVTRLLQMLQQRYPSLGL